VRFYTAQFKEHSQKLTRRTYLIPPPSVVAGVFGAMLGVKREELWDLGRKILAGVELRSIGGRTINLVRIFKIDRPLQALLTLLREYYRISSGGRPRNEVLKEIEGLLTVKESEELYKPEYKFAIASHDEAIIEKGIKRVKELNFEYDIFGGNDYHFVDFIGELRVASVEKSNLGRGYCPLEYFEGVETNTINMSWNADDIRSLQQPLITPVTFIANINKIFIQVYGAEIKTKRELEVVSDGESKIFVYKVEPFLILRGV
jgi:CRISPR-associated Cas5-like protein